MDGDRLATEEPARTLRQGDAEGACLSEVEIAGLRASATGEVPAALARHLAACERCQERALFGKPRAPRSLRRPSLRRAFGMVAIVLVALALLFYSVLQFAGFFG